MTEREHYTRAGFEAMKDRLSRAAIEKGITRQAFDAVGATAYLARTAEGGYEFALDHGTGLEVDLMPPQERAKYVVHVWPPIGPEHAGPRQTMRDLNGEWLPEQTDVWATHYQPWFERVDAAFEGWDQLPDERDFHDAARNFEGASDFIKLDPKALPSLSGNDDVVALLGALDAIFAGPDDMNGKTVSAFRANYQGKLDLLVAQQYWIAQMLTAKLQATGDMWREARQNVMEIGKEAAESMGDPFGRFDPAPDPRVARAQLTAVGKFADDIGYLKIPFVSNTAQAVAIGVMVYDELAPPPVYTQVEEIFNGTTPENVMDNIFNALSKLDRQIVDEENAVGTWARGIADKTYERSTPKRVGFNLGPPQLITDSSAEHIEDELRIKPTWMRYGAGLLSGGVAGTEAPNFSEGYYGPSVDDPVGLADHLDLTSVNLAAAVPSAAAWQRPAHIGVNGIGPREAWTALLDRLVDLLKDTSNELTAAGEHLVLAADAIEGVDKNSQDALEKHVADVADVAAPEPGRPPRQETPVGGAKP